MERDPFLYTSFKYNMFQAVLHLNSKKFYAIFLSFKSTVYLIYISPYHVNFVMSPNVISSVLSSLTCHLLFLLDLIRKRSFMLIIHPLD